MDPTCSTNLSRRLLTLLASASLMIPAGAQSPLAPPVPDPPKPAAADETAKTFVPQLEVDETTYVKKSMAELERLVAPVALYPDELLAQILPSATSPLDVVKAHQFLLEHPDLKEPPAEAVRNWDPAVVSLMQFPDVIKKMAGDIQWTTSLGEAVFFQEEDVYDAIQLVRSKAQAKGMLVDNDKQIHVQESEIIRIEPSDPQVIYVPQYDPEVIYVDRPVVVYEPLITYSRGISLGWGLCWSFDWYRHRCIPHHHWYYTWHHRRYHHHYGRDYHAGHHPRRPVSVRPPGGRPPRPTGWKPRSQRPVGWKPPRPGQTIVERSGVRPGSRLADPGTRTVWKPTRPGGRRNPGARTGSRPSPLVAGDRSTTSRVPGTRPSPTTTRPGTRPGTLRTTRPGTTSTRDKPLTSRTGTRPAGPNVSSTRPGTRSTASKRPGTPSARPGSSPGALRTTKPSARSSRPSSCPSSRPTTAPSRSATPKPRPGSKIASSSRSRTPSVPSSSTRGTSGSTRSSSGRPSSSGIRMAPLKSSYQRNLRPSRPSSSTRVSPAPSRSTSRPSPVPSRSSRTRVSPAPSRSSSKLSPAPSRSSRSRVSPAPSRSSRSRVSPSRSSPRPSPSRSPSSRGSSSRGRGR